MKTSRTVCIGILLFTAALGMANAATRYSTAQVTGVELGVFPDVRLRLNIEGLGERTLSPYYPMTRGGVDFASRVTQANLVCYYLLVCDRIEFSLMESPTETRITDVVRLGSRGRVPPEPTPVIHDESRGGLVLKASIETDKRAYRVGETVRFVFTITNTSQEPVELNYPTGHPYEFVVYENELEIWRWSHGKMFTMAFRKQILKPGESLIFSESWNQHSIMGRSVSAGVFKLVAELPIRAAEKPTAWTTITIKDR